MLSGKGEKKYSEHNRFPLMKFLLQVRM